MPAHFHVFSRSNDSQKYEGLLLDLSQSELKARFVKPYHRGAPVFDNGRSIPTKSLRDVAIVRTEEPSTDALRTLAQEHRDELERILREEGRRVLGSKKGRHLHELVAWGEDVTSEFIKGPPGSRSVMGKFVAYLHNPWLVSIVGAVVAGIILYLLFGDDANG